MWFDPYKLTANANFGADVGGDFALGGSTIGSAAGNIPVDPALAETPPSAPGGMTAGGLPVTDALNPAAAPLPGSTANPFSPAGMVGAGTSPPDLGGFGADLTGGADAAQPTFYSATPGTSDTSETYSPIAGTPASTTRTTPTAPSKDTGYSTEVDKITGATPGRATQPGTATLQPTAGTVGGAAGANAVTNFANAFRGLAQAAQAGNPQAQQIMNMLRQFQAMQQMQQMGMMGAGQQYNPYMNQNQFNNPWAARRRMEQMRREFMERQRLRRQLYGGAAGRSAATPAGRGRR